jgi:hypothetical protein
MNSYTSKLYVVHQVLATPHFILAHMMHPSLEARSAIDCIARVIPSLTELSRKTI